MARSCHARSVRATAATRRAGARIEKKLLCPMCPMTENAAIA
nr:MAG TPA: optinuerin [Caudoviricetes sp.]